MRGLKRIAGKIGLKLIRFAAGDSNLVAHAKREWKISFPGNCEMQAAIGQNLADMVAVFSLEGHSGGSASYTAGFIENVLRYKPLSPLKGTDDEWTEIEAGLSQNVRAGNIFKKDGQAYNIDGKVFVEPSGAAFTNGASRVNIEFPYTPKTEYVNVPESADILED